MVPQAPTSGGRYCMNNCHVGRGTEQVGTDQEKDDMPETVSVSWHT